PVLLEDLLQPVPVADVGVEVGVGAAQVADEAAQAPAGRAVLTEEVAAQVVVDADHVQAEPGEVAGRLRADQSGRAGHQCDTHENSRSSGGPARAYRRGARRPPETRRPPVV